MFSPALADFGAQALGTQSAAFTLSLVNAATLVPSALVLNGADPYDFRSAAHNTLSYCGVGKPIADTMRTAGWIAEGPVFCAPQ